MLVISGTFEITIRAVNHDPVWVSNPPPIQFKSGVPARFNISRFVSDSDGDTLTIVVNGTLDKFPGLSFDGADLVFDGRDIGRENLVGSLVFSADDGRVTETSLPA